MTTIKSGFFTTPTNTPSGQRKKIAVDNPYLSKAEFLTNEFASGLGITANSLVYTNGRIDKLLLSASAQVNRLCRRWFDTQTIDETKTGIQIRPMNPELVTMVMQNIPYQQINSIYIQVLKWFIQIDTNPTTGYLQDFPDYGYFRIVPLLSNSGTGVGSPMPAEIVDKTPLGVLWANYTFGYGTPFTGEALSVADVNIYKKYQADIYHQLWAPDQTLNVYVDTVLQAPTAYTVDFPNGIITFKTPLTDVNVVTADFISNESIPQDIKDAVALMVAESLGQGAQNALGANSMGIQTYSINFGENSKVRKRAEEMLGPYMSSMPVIL